MKTAIVHEWLTLVTGSEKVVENIYKIYPSPIFVLLHNPRLTKGTFFEGLEIHTSFIQKLPGSMKNYRKYLALFPLAIEQFDLREYDVILSSSHAVAKGVLTTSEQLHITYCHTPIRYAWDLYFEYLETSGLKKGLKGLFAKWTLHNLRKYDFVSAQRPDYIIANSNYVQKRIKKFYRRDSTVIYPPVDVENFEISGSKDDYYLVVSRLVPYKRVDLVVTAFKNLKDRRLIVIGDGPDLKKIKSISPPNVEIIGHQPLDKLKGYYSRARALIYPQIEDFGITAVEAMASGTPVIAFGKGGALETVKDMETGIFFHEQNPESLIEAIRRFERIIDRFDPTSIRNHAFNFSSEKFREKYKAFVEKAIEDFFG